MDRAGLNLNSPYQAKFTKPARRVVTDLNYERLFDRPYGQEQADGSDAWRPLNLAHSKSTRRDLEKICEGF